MEDTPPPPTATGPSPLSPDEAAAAGDRLTALLDDLGRVVLGQELLLERLAVALIAGGHVLLEGVPGTAKTLSAQALASALSVEFTRLQFTPDLMPADVTGVSVFDPKEQRFEFHPGPVFTDLLLGDEINRAPAKTQSALLEAMQERRVTVDGESRSLGSRFTVIATQNPVEFEGTYPLPEAQLDRFLMAIPVDYPSEEHEIHLLERTASGFNSAKSETFGLATQLAASELDALRALAERVRVEPEVVAYIARVVRATREDPLLTLGASPRASVALFNAARALALVRGRDFVTPDDVKDLAEPVLRHRVVLSPEAQVEGAVPEDRVRAALATVEAPR